MSALGAVLTRASSLKVPRQLLLGVLSYNGSLCGLQVACLADGAAHLALEKGDAFALQTKPHGHGDVHSLLHTSGLLRRWVAGGTRWVCFFQDTNALVFRALPAALGANSYLLCLPVVSWLAPCCFALC